MNTVTKKIEIEFEKGGRFIAAFLENEAPETCKAVLLALPIVGDVRHSMWSGRNLYMFTDFWVKTIENPKRITYPGEVLFDPHFVPIGPANKPTRCEILFPYGKDAVITDRAGIPTVANHFATITDDLQSLEQVGMRVHEKGFEKVQLRRIE